MCSGLLPRRTAKNKVPLPDPSLHPGVKGKSGQGSEDEDSVKIGAKDRLASVLFAGEEKKTEATSRVADRTVTVTLSFSDAVLSCRALIRPPPPGRSAMVMLFFSSALFPGSTCVALGS